jgi:hypothetical protein
MTRFGYFLSSEEYDPASQGQAGGQLYGTFEFFATRVLPRVREN